MLLTILVIAQTTPTTTGGAGSASPFDNPLTFVNFGVLGLMIAMMLTGYLWAKPSVDRLVAERDRLITEKAKAESQRDAMAQVFQDKLLPVVEQFITTTSALMPMLQQLIPILQEVLRHDDDQQPPRRRGRAAPT